jgi:AraC-like DNA-binding protein
MNAPAAGTYRELPPPPGLADLVACSWWRTTPAGGAAHAHVLPDGCVDVVARLGGPPFVAGPDTRPVAVRTAGEAFAGVRFRTGCAAAALGVPADELRDLRVGLGELWGADAERLEGVVAVAAGPAAAVEAMLAAVWSRRAAMAPPDRLVLAAVDRLRRPGPAGVAALAAALGASERALRRRFSTGVGYGPKTYHRIGRLRRLLAAADAGDPGGLVRLARAAGYADQAHMTRECGALAGITPAALLGGRAGGGRNVRDASGAGREAGGRPRPWRTA